MLKACSIGLCKGGKCLAMGFETFVKDSVNYFASGQDSLEIMSLLCFLSFLTIQFCFLQNNINQMQNTKGVPTSCHIVAVCRFFQRQQGGHRFRNSGMGTETKNMKD